jgi:hypothetical protein
LHIGTKKNKRQFVWNNVALESVFTIGILVDLRLAFDDCILSVYRKIFSRVYALFTVRKFNDSHSMLCAYIAYVILELSNSVFSKVGKRPEPTRTDPIRPDPTLLILPEPNRPGPATRQFLKRPTRPGPTTLLTRPDPSTLFVGGDLPTLVFNQRLLG